MNNLDAALEAQSDQPVQDLMEYLRIPSISAHPTHREDMQRGAEWLANHCRGVGLNARVHPTGGCPVVLARTFRRRSPHKPHFLVYGHYDVQPPDPLDLWESPPFEPAIRNGSIYARGASDNKGQHFAHLKAVEAYIRAGVELPCDLTFLIEGEEEIGSPSLPPFLQQNREALVCSAVVVSDNGIPSLQHPTLTYALRGVAALEVHISGPDRDLHSGIYGGAVDNPAMVLCRMLARLRDPDGRITVPKFYDEVDELTDYERRELERLPHNDRKLRRFLGVPALFGESGYSSTEQRSARPTLEINGLTSGYQGPGSKTIIPAKAGAKLTFRLVPRQKTNLILNRVCKYLRSICPPTVRLTMEKGHCGEPYLVSPSSAAAEAAMRALQATFQRPPILAREGGSIPIVNEFKRILKADTLLLGLALPDDNAHSPNEKFSLDSFALGRRLGTRLWPELAGSMPPRRKS